MIKKGIDRRVARTRAALQQAHVSLILKRGYEAVTVEDICEAANVGRSTFYAHFTGKDDLRRSGFEHLRKQLTDREREALSAPRDVKDQSFGFSLTMFEHARDHIDLYRALIGGRGGAIALGAIAASSPISCAQSLPLLRAKIPPLTCRATLSSNTSSAPTWRC